MQTKHLGNVGITVLALVNMGVWLIFPAANNGRPDFMNQVYGEMLSSTAMVLMGCAFILALRPRVLEPYFGGLDKMYISHKNTAITGMIVIYVHTFTVPIIDKASIGAQLGAITWTGLLVLVLLALAPRIPFVGGYLRLAYHHWRWTHKFIGAFYILGVLHSLLVPNVIQTTLIPHLYLRFFNLIGSAAYLYKELIAPFVGPPHNHVVEAARKLNGTTIEVTLKPKGAKPRQTAGQFMFVSFAKDSGLTEPHPFTVSSAPQEGNFRLSIKASGDWTRQLVETLRPGTQARVDGCYGMFNYKTGGPQQIWIAGGIGITPFLSWVRDFNGEPQPEIDFFYTVRSEADALFWDEMQAAAQKYTRFRAHLTVSSKEGSLSTHKIVANITGKLAEKHVYLCGPLPMTEAFRKQFRREGVPAGNIYFEEFNFR